MPTTKNKISKDVIVIVFNFLDKLKYPPKTNIAKNSNIIATPKLCVSNDPKDKDVNSFAKKLVAVIKYLGKTKINFIKGINPKSNKTNTTLINGVMIRFAKNPHNVISP